jgi:hypothetical protein
MPPKFTAATPSSSQASGQMDCLWEMMTSSMICRWISGIAAVATVPIRAPPRAMTTLRR